jgi:hypothetical protein
MGDAQLPVTTQALDDAATRIIHYLLMQSGINFVYGICLGIGLWIIGITSPEHRFPNVLLWALLAMLLRFLPYFGLWIAAALPIVLSFVLFHGLGAFFATLCLYLGLEIVTSNLVEPWLYGASTGVSAVAVLASAVFWAWLWGPIGLLLSTPLTVCLVVLGRYVPQLQFLAVLLGDQEVLKPAVRTYQRLLSLDQEEAGKVLNKYRKEHGLLRVFDDVMIPALVLAEKDRCSGRLEPDREIFIGKAMRELVEEMSDVQKKEIAAATVVHESDVCVLCLPAHSEADEIVGQMLAQLLELSGQRTIAVSQVSLASEMLELIQAQKAAVVCVSALPPAALTHSRYLCKRLHRRFVDLPVLVGLWTSKGDASASLDRLPCGKNVRVVKGLAGALDEIHGMVQPLLLRPARVNEEVDAKTESRQSEINMSP